MDNVKVINDKIDYLKLKDFGKGHSLMFKLSYINFQNVNDSHFSKNKFVENELTK